MSMTIDIAPEVLTRTQAVKFVREHVIMKRADLKKIGALCKKHGIAKELKALGIEMRPLDVGKGGSW